MSKTISSIGKLSTPAHVVTRSAVHLSSSSLTLKHILDHGADVNARIRAKRRTPLHLAALSRCQLSIIACLVDGGAKVNCVDNHHTTPLHLAAKMAPIFDSHKPPEKWQISWVACRMIIEILIRYTAIDENEWDTLCSQVVRLLRKGDLRISHRLSSGKVNRTEKTHDAASWFNGFLKLLCSKGASVNARNDRNHNVLQYATLFWASWISKYHASLLCDNVVWGPDEMTKEAAEVEWSRILHSMNPRMHGRPYVGSQIPSQKRRRFGN